MRTTTTAPAEQSWSPARHSVTGASLPYTVRRTTVFDASTLSATTTDLNRMVRLPGGGVVTLAAGRETVHFGRGFPPATVDTAAPFAG